MSFRPEQVASRIQEELAEIIRTRLSDPRMGYVTITRVQVSDDLSFARVWVSELPVAGHPSGQSIKVLNHAMGFIRSELGQRLRLRRTPELRFQDDHSIETGIRINTLLDSLAEDSAQPNSDRLHSEQKKQSSGT